MAAIDFKTFNSIAHAVLAQRLPVMVRGARRAEVVYQAWAPVVGDVRVR